MTYKTMQDDQLQEILLKTVQRERQLTAQILEMLKEVEERRLFVKRGYSSLHVFCTECLGYSEGAAHRRISSMRLMREVPEVKSKLENGTINISNLSKAASFFRQEEKLNKKTYTHEQKEELLLNLEGKSQKEVEKYFVKLSPQVFSEKTLERALSDELTEIRLTLDSVTINQLQRLKELKPGMNTKELIQWMLQRSLKQIDPLLKPRSEKTKVKKVTESAKDGSLYKAVIHPPLRRALPQSTRAHVWQKAQGRCQFHDLQTGNKCRCRTGLEIDHIRPLALGGTDELSNLRLLCREHHRQMTTESFGPKVFRKKPIHLRSGGADKGILEY